MSAPIPGSGRSRALAASQGLAAALDAARYISPQGSVSELSSKRLLALNLRKLGGEELQFTPRSYILTSEELGGAEFADFVRDYKLSHALAVLQRVALSETSPTSELSATSRLEVGACNEAWRQAQEQAEGLHGRVAPAIPWEEGPVPTQPIAELELDSAIFVVSQALSDHRDGHAFFSSHIAEDHWRILRCLCPLLSPVDAGLAGRAEEARALLEEIPKDCQVAILERNLWVLKPCSNGGGNGRGILLLDRLPAQHEPLLCWAVAVGRAGHAGASDARDGCVLQKLVERPHLLDRRALLRSSCAEAVCSDGADVERNDLESHACRPPDCLTGPTALFKYNLRMWLDVALSNPPEVWLYDNSYVDLAGREFSPILDPGSHVTNLLRGDPTRGRSVFQRHWSIQEFAAYLRQGSGGGSDPYAELILPQVRSIIVAIFRALRFPPSSLQHRSGSHCSGNAIGDDSGTGPLGRLKRLGLDFLVDEHLHVWLMEVNVLKRDYGLAAAKGPGGDVKRHLVARLREAEAELQEARAGRRVPPEGFENLVGPIMSDSDMLPLS
mmetsp:Transcript_137204/g.438764  ORF Transcript_137204/g.438764 Transcript_137204/m.438764 type:complete len:556 (+) Transcript_137204:287-1954(+)|eukprot:CAMPEP_0203887618 /NCGR_PEP_ID=MMETSP0359-20131031/31310_1 /ASSEMBLY_ACC=CAM_ASM_000338 /TAXON_ID=268821 /ORGANISM="Scrippsiella Hangoei, Strain SHTV-5" /LENGTH=555 /DNA_ID=CAMNT_0050808673 /DNA_START=250 /DNA_END=1917 /DNA_ORIENTATION=-